MKKMLLALPMMCILWAFCACSSEVDSDMGLSGRYFMNRTETIDNPYNPFFDDFKSCIYGTEYTIMEMGDEMTQYEEGFKKEHDYTLELNGDRAALRYEFKHRQNILNQMAHKQRYMFKPQKKDFVEITNDAIFSMGVKKYDLNNGCYDYFERYGEATKGVVNHPVEVSNENFTCKQDGDKVILMNDNRTCEMSFLQGGCRLVQIYPNHEVIGDFYKEGETVVSPPDKKPNVQPQGSLEIRPASAKLGKLASTVYFSIESNTDWVVSVNNTGDSVNGLKVYPLKGTGNATITVEYGTVESQFYGQSASINVTYLSYGCKQTRSVVVHRRNLPY